MRLYQTMCRWYTHAWAPRTACWERPYQLCKHAPDVNCRPWHAVFARASIMREAKPRHVGPSAKMSLAEMVVGDSVPHVLAWRGIWGKVDGIKHRCPQKMFC